MAELYHGTFGTSGRKAESFSQESKSKMADVDLRSLIELGCVRDNVVIGDITFTMRTLNISERLETLNFLGENPDAQKVFEFNMRVLSMSIEAANGRALETMHPRFEEGCDPLALKKELVTNMQPSVLNMLVEFYGNITARSEAQFSTDQVKNL